MLRRNGRTELTQKTFIFRRLIYAVIFLTGFVGGTARSQENQTCLECHSDPSLIGTCGGKEISVTVDLKILSASVHASLDCIACHQDLAGAALPHTEVLKSVDCGACHDKEMKEYRDSIHATLGVRGARCSDCHGTHGIIALNDPRSLISATHISLTCGRCHRVVEEAFRRSIHSPVISHTCEKLPTCVDCHAAHALKPHDRQGARFDMMTQCGKCHVMEVETFFETYHGKVLRLGLSSVATCTDCHGLHDILPISHPQSHLSRFNVVATCARCHPNAHYRFTGYLAHASHYNRQKYPLLFYTFWGMTALLVGTLSFALLHTCAWVWRLWRSRHLWQHLKLTAETGKFYIRFSLFQRVLHLVMLFSFFILALTGMAIKFSYAPWAQFLSRMFGGHNPMAGLHHVGAMTLFFVFCVHLWDMRRRKMKSGLSWLRFIRHPDSLAFNSMDLKEFWNSIKWFFNLGPRPHYGRYTYWEKFDYFAVLWGVALIGSTGLVLWFPEFFTRFLPGEIINVAAIIHSDEALLAVAFIFTIHFFNTHFRPDKFPMDLAIFTGRVSFEEMKYDKPREYENLIADNKLECSIATPFPPSYEKAIRIFALAALIIGLTLIGLIMYAMVLGHR